MFHHLVTETHLVRTHLHFDLDGTLADTETFFHTYWKQTRLDEIRPYYPLISEEEREDLDRQFSLSHGCTFSGFAEALGLDKKWVDDAYHRQGIGALQLASQLPINPNLVPLVTQVKAWGRVTILTQAREHYAKGIVTHLGLDALVEVLRHRAYKRTAEPFQQILAEEGHLEAHHWLIEDSPANLPMAKHYGFTTVLVGPRRNEGSHADYRFNSVENFLRAFINNNGLTPCG
jgi:FMN phosphatase YigB (HAD superfamily)